MTARPDRLIADKGYSSNGLGELFAATASLSGWVADSPPTRASTRLQVALFHVMEAQVSLDQVRPDQVRAGQVRADQDCKPPAEVVQPVPAKSRAIHVPPFHAVRVTLAAAQVAVLNGPKMSFSPLSATIPSQTCTLPRAASSEPVPVERANFCALSATV